MMICPTLTSTVAAIMAALSFTSVAKGFTNFIPQQSRVLLLSSSFHRYGTSRLFCTPAATGATTAKAELTELSRLEIRVGKILEIGKHPEAGNLYVEKVDCGEAGGPRTIISGLVEYCTEDQLLNKKVVVLANLKPRAIKGIESHGMILCASSTTDDKKVEPLIVPEGTAIGQLITFVGHQSAPEPPGNRATKAYSKIADDFFVDEEGRATYQGVPFMTPEGPCTSNLKGKIS